MKPSKPPYLVVSDGCGNVFEIPDLWMAGMTLAGPVVPEDETLLPLPFGSDLFELPKRIPLGYHPKRREFVEVRDYRGQPVYAVAGFMAPAYVQCYRSAYVSLPNAPRLALYSYTAIGWRKGEFVAAGMRIDPDTRQDLRNVDLKQIQQRGQQMLTRYPNNRLVRHLVENCVCRYGCPAARNFVMERWECPAPTSPACNADCVGCISEQPDASGVKPPQDRICFVPTPEEIAEFTVPHLNTAPRAVISFGQGCEGEPLLVGDTLEAAIRLIRQRTDKGVINLNTNASLPHMVERLFAAGLDSMRVSLNSAQPSVYTAYYQPRSYTFDDVLESLRIARKFDRWTSLNYFVFPGLTDHPAEMAALERILSAAQVNMIQARNMNIDPEWYSDVMGFASLSPEQIGIPAWVRHFRKRFPALKFGYFNPPREDMG